MKEKTLILGGRSSACSDYVEVAKKRGLYTVVSDFYSIDKSIGKRVADESWDISVADIDILVKKCKEANIKSINSGPQEFNIDKALMITKALNLPFYCDPSTWIYCEDKTQFKRLCMENSLPVAHKYQIQEVQERNFPVITKPVDSSGSRGFHICNNREELEKFYKDAESFSPTKRVLIEDFIPYDSVIIHYTMVNGKCHYSGMSDKISVKFANTGSSVMGIQTFPSKGEDIFLKTLDEKVRDMFEKAGFTEGPIWIESFFDGKDKFVFNEMGYRFGGSLTYYPVRYFYGVDQLDLLIQASLGKVEPQNFVRTQSQRKYCIIPIHIHAGTITAIEGLEELKNNPYFYAFAQTWYVGDIIEETGSLRQVFGYLHVLYDDIKQLKETLRHVKNTLQVKDENGKNLLFTLFDIEKL